MVNIYDIWICPVLSCRSIGVKHNNLNNHLRHMVNKHNWKVPGIKKKKKKGRK